MQIQEIKPQFILIMGGAGSGKNHFIANNSIYSNYNLIDVDIIKGEIGVANAIGQIMPMLVDAFDKQENIVHSTTGSNLRAQQNKIKMAKHQGYTVTLVLVDAPIEQAIENIRNRVRQGGHDVEIENIVSTNKKARENFEILKSTVDKSEVV
jgi:predicted ABC-type ATPase